MSAFPNLRTLSDQELKGARIIAAGPANLRRDLYHFVRYVQSYGLTRTYRDNSIPKAAARKLAKMLSYKEEAQAVKEVGAGFWSDRISHIARTLGLVSFNIEGTYIGYTSTTASYPDNHIIVDTKRWKEYLHMEPREKERAIVDALIQMTPNEFFASGTLLYGERFDTWGSATGAASRMNLPQIRRSLMKLLTQLNPNVWYDTRAFVELLHSEHPDLILDPATREPDYDSATKLRDWEWEARDAKRRRQKEPPRPNVRYEDIYTNFREFDRSEYRDYSRRKEKKIKSGRLAGFYRVEGRYIEWFLSEVPYIAGFVDLAFRNPQDPYGRDVVPEFEQLLAFRLSPLFFAIMGDDPLLDRVNVTALPNFDIVVDALSYPETTLAKLEHYAVLTGEDGPVLRFRLDRKKVIDASAAGARHPAEVLNKLSGKPIPANVAADLESWCGHGEKLVFFGDQVALFELRGAPRDVLEDVREYLVDPGEGEFAFVRSPDKVFDRFEKGLHVPARVMHPGKKFAAAGFFAAESPAAAGEQGPRKEPPLKVRLQSEDLVGFRSPYRALLEALHETLRDTAATCLLPEAGDLLVVSAAALPKLRSILRELSDRFEVETEARPAASKKRMSNAK